MVADLPYENAEWLTCKPQKKYQLSSDLSLFLIRDTNSISLISLPSFFIKVLGLE